MKTREPQYQKHVELSENKGLTQLGILMNAAWEGDPRRLLFTLARYKFVAKMLSGMRRVLEVGCGDAFGTRLVRQEVETICAVDFDPIFVKDIADRIHREKWGRWEIEVKQHDMLTGPLLDDFDAAYSLDVFEHISKKDEDVFLKNIVDSLNKNPVLIIGIPSLQSQVYASEGSKQGHVNCKDGEELRRILSKYFYHVFMFSMNDEVVHTGYYPMAQYLLALCVGKRI